MSILSQNQRLPNIIPANTEANAISLPVFAPDFDKLQFSLLTNSAADFDITVIKSNQELPPDPSAPVSPTNMYADCMFSEEGTQVNYNATTPYNPGSTAVDKNFLVQTQGARWFFVKLSNYSDGILLKLDAFLFSNET